MASTITTPTTDVVDERTTAPGRGPNRGLQIAVAVLAVLALGLGIALAFQLTEDDTSATVPDDVQAVLDEFLVAMTAHDYDAVTQLVTADFRRPWYEGDPFGPTPYRDVYRLESYEFMRDEEPIFEAERLGEPIVRGEGPWYVSYAEDWHYPDQQVTYEAIYTYVVVDLDGELRIDDGYWAGHSVVSDQD